MYSMRPFAKAATRCATTEICEPWKRWNPWRREIPDLNALMIGRGAVADPALLRKLRGGAPATREELMAFTRELYQSYQDFYGQAATASQRMKEVWFYLIPPV